MGLARSEPLREPREGGELRVKSRCDRVVPETAFCGRFSLAENSGRRKPSARKTREWPCSKYIPFQRSRTWSEKSPSATIRWRCLNSSRYHPRSQVKGGFRAATFGNYAMSIT